MKAAFTRTYNKEVHLTPYSLQAVKKGRRGGGGESELGGEDVDNEAQESEDEGLKTDAMIKVRTFKLVCTDAFDPGVFISVAMSTVSCASLQQKKTKPTKETKTEKEDSGKGKGKGKGKGTGKAKK